jgi:hypothetical protein
MGSLVTPLLNCHDSEQNMFLQYIHHQHHFDTETCDNYIDDDTDDAPPGRYQTYSTWHNGSTIML